MLSFPCFRAGAVTFNYLQHLLVNKVTFAKEIILKGLGYRNAL